mmetsp:Transcript_71808/g.153516  ORF Transcript_71808/g.153516 Transcript_71808/m.153516 type:complete len:112 (+) Transcript_71808:72-407(+)
MARTSSRGSCLLALCALVALTGMDVFGRRTFLVPLAAQQSNARSLQTSSKLVGSWADEAAAEQLTAMQFFEGTSEPPKPKKEKPFKLPPFFTTFLSLGVVIGACVYFLSAP